MSVLNWTELDRVRLVADGMMADPAFQERADQTAVKVLESLRRRHVTDPLLRSYMQYLTTTRRNTQGWHAFGERLYAQLLALTAGTSGGIEFGNDVVPGKSPEGRGVWLFLRLAMAQCYLWSNVIHDHVEHSPPLPRHIISRTLLPYPMMFWSRETARVGVVSGPGASVPYFEHTETNWVLLSDEGTGFNQLVDVVSLDSDGHPLKPPECAVRILGGGVRYGTVWPDDYQSCPEPARTSLEYTLKALAFLASPYIDARSERLPRPMRRERQRKMVVTGTDADPTIRVVVLRVPERREESEEADARDFVRRHHWWVTGHFRAQWYPTQQAHKVIWIAPHLQGDRSLPLLNKVYKVAR